VRVDEGGRVSVRERWRLSEADIAAYRRDGLVKSPHRLPPALLGDMRESLDRLLRDNAGIAPESLICPHIPYGESHDAKAAARWLAYASNPAILDLVEQLIGPDVILWGSQVFCKPAFTGKTIPWHQDGQYWPIRPLATCSVWLALDDTTPENGCMRFIPGSQACGSVYRHRRSTRTDVVLDQEVEPSQFDESTARDDALAAGEFSLHDVFLIHGSNANLSPRRRAGFVIRYMPATSVVERAAGDAHRQAGVSFSMSRRPIWLLRGRDRSGLNDFSTGHGQDYALVPRLSDEASADGAGSVK
jgi:ectoine hydroxylase-related dioxygenase (phytanoyl-CoA dioxygenase family)